MIYPSEQQRGRSVALTVGSLFSGVGGFDLAAQNVGMKVLWTSELDDSARSVLEHRFPDTNHFGDIHDIRIGYNRAYAPDIMVGGFPCQSYSIAGGRGGLAEDRGALWWEFHRLVREARPTWVVGENVSGLLSSAGGRDFATICRSLVQLGYGVSFRVLDAQHFGVPQRRRRVFIVGHLGGEPRPEVLALAEGVYGNPPSRRKKETVASSITGSSVGGGGGPDDNSAQANHLVAARMLAFGEYVQDDMASTLKERDYKDATDLIEVRPPADTHRAVIMRMREGKPGGGKGPLLSDDQSLTLSASSNDQVLFETFAENQRGEVRETDVVGALPANGKGGRQLPMLSDGYVVRRLTPTECERLQGFPDGWCDTPGSSDTSRYRQMGNAVAVPVVEWILGNIAKAER